MAGRDGLLVGGHQDIGQSRVDLVERVGWRVYDSYLKSQGVGEGVRSYSRVVELIVRSRRTPAGDAVPQ